MDKHPQKQSDRKIKDGRPKPIFHRIISMVAFSRIKQSISNMKFFSPCLGLGLVFFVASSALAQLADTIWEVEVEIQALNLQAVREGVPLQGPNLKNGTIRLPMELWFWNESQCGLVFSTEKWGLRDSYEWSWGSPGEPGYSYSFYLGPKYWGGGSLAPSYENEEGKVTVTSTYNYNASKRTGTLLQKTLYLLETSTRQAGSYWQINGTFAVSGNKLTVRNASFTLQPNPSGLNSYRVLSAPRLKPGTIFLKTTRKPSIEKDVQASFKYFSENSWD